MINLSSLFSPAMASSYSTDSISTSSPTKQFWNWTQKTTQTHTLINLLKTIYIYTWVFLRSNRNVRQVQERRSRFEEINDMYSSSNITSVCIVEKQWNWVKSRGMICTDLFLFLSPNDKTWTAHFINVWESVFI